MKFGSLNVSEINTNRFFSSVEGYPQIALVIKEPDQKYWWFLHTDHSYDIAPALGSMLFAHEVLRSGGDTVFASIQGL